MLEIGNHCNLHTIHACANPLNPRLLYKGVISNFACDTVSFGKIEPKHLFINISGFHKNEAWANKMIDVVERNAQKLRETSIHFDELIDDIAKEYHSFFIKNQIKFDKNDLPSDYGERRSVTGYTHIYRFLTECKYKTYYERMFDVSSQYIEITKHHSSKVKRPFPLTEIMHRPIPPSLQIAHPVPDNEINQHIKTLYAQINEMRKNSINPEEKAMYIEQINQKIAEMHWYLAHVMPFKRGSAGITDILIKTIYESLDIQVSPWKQGLAPDLEAFVTPLGQYIKQYPNYFESPPFLMEK